jgi:hypothetical protein
VQLFTVVQQERAAAKEAAALAEAAAKAAAVKAAAAAAAVPVRKSPPRRASANTIAELFYGARTTSTVRATESGEQREGTQEPAAVHRGVRCDVCNTLPIVGIRYKCAVREVCTELYHLFISALILCIALFSISCLPAAVILLKLQCTPA